MVLKEGLLLAGLGVAGGVVIHGGAYAEMSHLPFTRAVAGHPQGDRAAVGGHANQYWPVRLGGY